MIKRLLLIGALAVSVSGCFVAPIAFIGPATSGFSTASLIQSSVTTGTNYIVKKNTVYSEGSSICFSLQSGEML